MEEKLTKTRLAELFGISRPTLDMYLKNGLPKKIIDNTKILENKNNEIIEVEIIHLKASVEEDLIKIKYLNQKINDAKNEINKLENLLKEGK